LMVLRASFDFAMIAPPTPCAAEIANASEARHAGTTGGVYVNRPEPG
jgi:hypothetical protein